MDSTVEKMAKLQQEVRMNAQEAQDFMLELSGWQKEIEAKDQQLKMTKEVVKVSE